MITPDGLKLELLERFETDHSLPKFKPHSKDSQKSSVRWASDEEDDGPEEMASNMFGASQGSLWITNSSVITNSKTLPTKPLSLWARVVDLFSPLERIPAPALPPEPTLTIEEFFRNVKLSTEELTLVNERLAGYQKALTDAKRNGQTALFEKLGRDVSAVKAETQLHAIGLAKYLTEETLVDFVKKCPKGLKLSWVKNYMRVIPDEVSLTKQKCDSLGLFDNYAVLHYDPSNKAWAETHAEKERRKDPILFGLMAGRRRLYFVGDWVDELCDLTLEQIADLLGKDAVQEISEKVRLKEYQEG